MERVPLLHGGRQAGELTAEQEGLYTRLSASCGQPQEGVCCVWAVGENGELRVGVLEPLGGEASISRRFSGQTLRPIGRLLRGEVRPVGEWTAEVDWQPLTEPFRTPWLRDRLGKFSGVLALREEGLLRVAIPYDGTGPFPLTPLFCFASLGRAGGRRCVFYTFDREERPVFP